MDRLTNILFSMRERGAMIWVDSGQLRYRAPRGALSPEHMVLLREMKGEIITILNECPSLLAGTNIYALEPPPDIAPLTFQQEFHLSLMRGHDRNSGALLPQVVNFDLRISGALNVEALIGSLDALIRRHESLRTRIVMVRDAPMQKIDKPTEFRLTIVECAGDSLVERQNDARRVLRDFSRRSLDLSVGPIFDAKLLRVAEQEYVLALSWEHLTNDSTSLILLFGEIWRLYDDITLGKDRIRQPPPQYADYAVWQRKTYDRWMRDHSEYWKVRLHGAAPIQMPVDTSLAKADVCEGEIVRFSFSQQLSAALSDVAQGHRTSLGIVLLAVYCATISRICGQNDFVIPFNVAGRRSPEDIDVIGYFSHFLLLRIQLSGRESFPELLKTVSAELLTAHEHLDYGRTYDEQPLCHGMLFVWYPWSTGVLMAGQPNGRLRDICIAPLPPAQEPQMRFKASEKFRWALTCENSPEGIRGALSFRADLYALNMIQRCVRDLLTYSEQVAANLPPTNVR